MWEMGNRLISKFKSVSSVPIPVPVPVQTMTPSYLPPQYAGYNYYDIGQTYLDEELCTTSPSSSTPSYLPVLPIPPLLPLLQVPPSSSTGVKKTRAPRKTPVKSKPIGTIFDTCVDASYTRPSGIQWVEPEWVPVTPYKNKMIYAKVVDVYDGDTITIIIMYGDAPMKLKVRLQGVDAPELVVKRQQGRVYSAEEDELITLEMRAGAHVRDKVKKLIDQKEVIVKLIKCDKYGGRQVGAVYLKPQSYETLTEYLLSKRYGKPYQAQKKDDWTREELLYILNN